MKKIIIGSALLILVISLTFSDSWGQLRKIKVSFPSFVAGFAPLYVAKEKGFYGQEGLDPDFLLMRGFLAIQGLVAGEADFSVLSSVILGSVRGLDVKMVMVMDDKPLAFTAAKPAIKSVQDLKGKTIATTGPGSVSDSIVRRSLRHYGLDPGKDVTIVAMGGTPDRIKALEAGTIDAAIFSDIYALIVRKKGFNIVMEDGKIVPVPWDTIGTSGKLIREEPDLVRKFVRATMRGMKYLPGNKEDGVKAIAKYTKLEVTLLREFYEELIGMYSKDGRMPEKALELSIELYSELAGVKEKTSKDKVVDYRFLD